ncbi:MAG: TVP38/TMEM64 family protein [Gomphosphaeria aponina SAG 52.96 = DSM 107014]|uniref:TVP38/TMEM64 family membrane protein n=1 Tax=Gomphosphaeria aponina SAG 52.96 = DSM 107014 TaxID=1521640 RepID=A0A941GSA6_9CHRO|nr:TVP38/TMEM64 family protein [Gomphosphaeria aponina SAG 52.96 = DSM 107014]
MKPILTQTRKKKTQQLKSSCSPKVSWKSTRFWLGLAFAVGVICCFFGPGKVLFQLDFLVEQIQGSSGGGVMGFIGLYTLLTVMGVPGTILTVAGGVIFGLVWGTFWSVVGATLGAMGAFWTARYLCHDWVESRWGKHQALVKLCQAVKEKPLLFVLAVRFAPISPFNVVNFLFGLTPIHWGIYSLGTLMGIIPGTLVYTWLGVSGNEAWQGGDRFPFFLALAFLALLCAIPLVTGKK